MTVSLVPARTGAAKLLGIRRHKSYSPKRNYTFHYAPVMRNVLPIDKLRKEVSVRFSRSKLYGSFSTSVAVVNLLASFAALVRPWEMRNGDNEEAIT